MRADCDTVSASERLTGASKVLIVDDHEDKRELLSYILKRHDFTILQAENGRTALAMIAEERPDVVLLDVLMPEMDGFEVCRRMKDNPDTAEIPVLFVTVLDQDHSRVEGLKLGAEDFINWPLNASELVARVNARIRSYRPLIRLRSVVQEQNRLLEEDRAREAATESELEQARAVQRRFVSTTIPPGRGLAFATYYRPCRKVGGDFYDVLPLNSYQVALAMADISGHGIPAALLTGITKVLFRTGAERCTGPGMLLRWINKQISAYLTTGEFVTMFLGFWNAEAHLFSYAGAGHPPALLIEADGSRIEWLHVARGIVGVMPEVNFPETTTELHVGQKIICYTDGITDLVSPDDQLLGEDRFAEVCIRHAKLPLDEFVTAVFAEIDRIMQGEQQLDDQALLALEVTQ